MSEPKIGDIIYVSQTLNDKIWGELVGRVNTTPKDNTIESMNYVGKWDGIELYRMGKRIAYKAFPTRTWRLASPEEIRWYEMCMREEKYLHPDTYQALYYLKNQLIATQRKGFPIYWQDWVVDILFLLNDNLKVLEFASSRESTIRLGDLKLKIDGKSGL